MRNFIVTALLLTTSAQAEIKVINGTGQELLVDVLSKRGQVRDFKLAAEPSPSVNIGPKSPALETEMMVVKTPDGQEKYRAEVESGRIYIIGHWNPYIYTYVGEFRGEARDSFPHVVNASTVPVTADVSFSDFTTSNGWTIPGPDDKSTVGLQSLGSSRTAGEMVDVKLTPTDGGAGLSTKLKCGVVYWLSRGPDGNLKLDPIGVK